MAEIRPFRGLLYDSGKIGGDYASIVAPPYDVISEGMRDELYEKNTYNIIRLILGRSLEGDSRQNNKYTRAREILDRWQQEGVLVKDDAESFYIYLQEYNYNGQRRRRIGFIGLMKIEDSGKDRVLPHEHTLAGPKEDRLSLIKQVRSNLSPIFTLFEDNGKAVRNILEERASSSGPVIDIRINGERHKFWRLSDRESIDKIVSRMRDKKLFIADGHHRYEVARIYRDIRRQEEGYDGSADHVMMYFTDLLERDNLTIMAIHRVIKAMPVGEAEAVARLNEYFNITEYDDLSGLIGRLGQEVKQDHVFGFFGGRKHIFIKPRDNDRLLKLVTEEKPVEWKRLDVSVLHSAVLERILSVSGSEGNITYVRAPEEAEALVRNGGHTAAFFLNPTRIEQLKAAAEQGEIMPQKSTYFYPKLLTGLVINRFRD